MVVKPDTKPATGINLTPEERACIHILREDPSRTDMRSQFFKLQQFVMMRQNARRNDRRH
jgi:hypothetical protein